MMEHQETNRRKISRRSFMKAAAGVSILAYGLPVLSTLKASAPKPTQNKRDLTLSVLNMSKPNQYVPGAFFMHFGRDYQSGQAAIDRHLEYFRSTDMDFVKIQYEVGMPRMEFRSAADWKNVPIYKEDFFEPVLAVIKGIVKSAKSEALIIPTAYSPFMCAGQIAGSKENLLKHVAEDPDSVAKGMERVTESVMNYIKASIKLGVDGFYMSTQGGEVNRIPDTSLFNKIVRPFDMTVMGEANSKCIFNILHICDYEGKYASLEPYASYPGKVVNTPISLADGTKITTRDAAALFKRPIMGGLNRLGEVAKGTPQEISQAVYRALIESPSNYVLGADCTVPGSTQWSILRSMIQQAHYFRA